MKVARIHFGELPSDFNKDTDIILSIVSLIGKENEIIDWDRLLNYEIFEDVEARAEARDAMTLVMNRIFLPELSVELNHHHGVEYNNDFWKILLTPWLLLVLHFCWHKYSQILALSKYYQDKNINVLLINKINYTFKDTIDFSKNGLKNVTFHHWVCSKIIESLDVEWNIEYSNHEYNLVNIEKKNLNAFIKEKIMNIVYPKNRCTSIHGAGILWNYIFSLLFTLKKKTKINTIVIPSEEKCKAKEPLSVDDIPLEFISLVRSILNETMPSLYRDGSFILSNTKFKKYQKGKIRHIGSSIWYNEELKLKSAYAKDKGEIVASSQHGGVYGTAKIPNIIPDIEYSLDFFITWGFKEHSPYFLNAISLPSPYLSNIKNKYQKSNNDLLLVGGAYDVFSLRFDSTPVGLQVLESRRNKVDFIKIIDGNYFRHIKYFPYPSNDLSIEDASYFKRIFPNLRVINKNLDKYLLKCKLVVVDHPQTVFLASLAANIPTILYWNSSVWAESEQSKPYFDKLRNVGILHESSQSAAEKINVEWDNLEKWWFRPEVQSAREVFCENYAQTSDRWWWEWAKVLWKI